MHGCVKRHPGQRGTKRWLKQYGEQLFCVRYRYDRGKRKRYTTVELIVDEADWVAGDTIVGVQVRWGEINMAHKVKAAGGQWNRSRLVWELPYRQVIALNMLERLVWLD